MEKGMYLMSIDYTDPSERKRFYNSAAWKKVRREAMERDHFECIWCKDEGKLTIEQYREEGKTLLEVDHIYTLEEHPHMRLKVSNLRTLCKRHHNERHGRYYSKEKKWQDERWD